MSCSKQKRPLPFVVIDCQSLLEQEGTYSGWLRRRINGLNKWSKRFVALNKGHVYIFKNETSKNHTNDFSLYGCKSVQPVESSGGRERTWIFKVVDSNGNAKHFTAASRIELQNWIERFNKEMQFANDVEIPSTNLTERVKPMQNPRARVYEEPNRLPTEGMSSEMCHQKHFNRRKAIYGTSSNRPLPIPPADTAPPSLPKRQSTQYSNYQATRNSHSDNDYDDQELDDEDYYNIKDDGNGYFSCMDTPMERRGVNDVYDDFEDPYKNIPRVACRVIAIEAFSSVYNNHFTFNKNDIFNVVNRAAEGWLVGEKDGQTGVFPEENIMQLAPAGEYAPLYGERMPPTVYDSLWFSGGIAPVDQHPECERQSKQFEEHNATYTVKATKSYTAGYRNEISFCKDDIFEVVGQESDRWLIGKINDKKGLFPSEYVMKCTFQSIDRTQDEEYSDTELQLPLNVIAIKSYIAKQEHELTLQKDAKFDVIGRISNSWLIGVLDGRRGTFPAECVKECSVFMTDGKVHTEQYQSKEQGSHKAKSTYSVIALKSYKATTDDELSFKKDDKFRVVGQETEQWLIGEINRNVGVFPAEYVKRVNLSQRYQHTTVEWLLAVQIRTFGRKRLHFLQYEHQKVYFYMLIIAVVFFLQNKLNLNINQNNVYVPI